MVMSIMIYDEMKDSRLLACFDSRRLRLFDRLSNPVETILDLQSSVSCCLLASRTLRDSLIRFSSFSCIEAEMSPWMVSKSSSFMEVSFFFRPLCTRVLSNCLVLEPLGVRLVLVSVCGVSSKFMGVFRAILVVGELRSSIC